MQIGGGRFSLSVNAALPEEGLKPLYLGKLLNNGGITMKAILFSARHSHAEIDGLPEIFSEGICPTDFSELDRQAQEFFAANNAEEYVIYVTGLTAATVAVIKAAVDFQVKLTLMHYDRTTDKYVPQHVVAPTLVEQGNDEWGVTVPMAWKEV